MMDEAQSRDSAVRTENRAGRRRLRISLLVIALVLVCLVLPPWISIGSYQGQVARILSQSVGRPVQISSVEMRLLPWPGFVINNLSIAEDPAYGAEPVLHANTVRANIRLLSLWQGRLEIGAIHVDEASLNIVRAAQGKWNLDPLFRTAAARAGGPASAAVAFRWPSLDATNSRINIKKGTEKLPFSLVNTDLSFWQESSGEWRIRLRGQPVRTDVSLEQGDTGTMRIEASMKRAPTLGQMPVELDVDWREAQMGALSKLWLGNDPGWRGDLQGNLHLEGSPAAAQITSRLRATGVHRAEFAPATALDFDANCALLYHYALRSVENLNCDSPLGNGRVHLTGGLPAADAPAKLTVELDRIPVGAGLDLLRTMRSGLAADLEAAGTASGRMEYAQQPETDAAPRKLVKGVGAKRAAAQGPLSGSITVDGFALSGGALTKPLSVPKLTLTAVEVADGEGRPYPAIEGSTTVDAGGTNPLNLSARLTSYGYQAEFRGQAAIVRARELALAAGWSQANALNNVEGEPLAVNLTAAGPWMAEEVTAPVNAAEAAQAHAVAAAAAALGVPQRAPVSDSVTGSITLHNANWKAGYLANTVEIAQATLHLDEAAMRWDSVDFTYGPVKGTAVITIPVHCVGEAVACAPGFAVQLGDVDASVLEAALLGAHQKGTLLSNMIDRLHPAPPPSWPVLSGTLSTESLLLGPAKLEKTSATVTFAPDHADFSALRGSLLGGQVQGSGTVRWGEVDQKQPTYSIEAVCDKLNAAAVGQLLGQRWTGGPMTIGGKVELAGFTDSDLAESAKGSLHFDWTRGAMQGGAATGFDEWSGDATVGDGAVTLGENTVNAGGRKLALEGAVGFGTPVKVKLAAAKVDSAKR